MIFFVVWVFSVFWLFLFIYLILLYTIFSEAYVYNLCSKFNWMISINVSDVASRWC